MRLIVFTFRNDIRQYNGGSTIRIKGYTQYLKEFGVSYKFVAPARPHYVHPDDFVEFRYSRLNLLMIKIHNILSQKKATKLISLILKYIILQISGIKKLEILSENTFILSHQNGSIPLFLKLIKGRKFIYDVHGIFSIQKEYLEDASAADKLIFYLSLAEEKYIYQYADIINITSRRMMRFIKERFNTSAGFALAPEGILEENINRNTEKERVAELALKFGIDPEDKVLFFAGNFKKFGGVHRLVDSFVSLAGHISNLKLFLIGSGQMEDYVVERIKRNHLEDQFIHIKLINHSDLWFYQQLATLIVCPDIENPYNELILHIKIFDSIASGKPVVATRFDVLEEVFPPDADFIRYAKSSNLNDLNQTIADSIKDLSWFRKADSKWLSELTYRRLCKNLVDQYYRLIQK